MRGSIDYSNKDNRTIYLVIICVINFLFFIDPVAIPLAGSSLILGFSDLTVFMLAVIVSIIVIKRGFIKYNSIMLGFLLFLEVSIVSLFYTQNIGRWLIGDLNYIKAFLILFIFNNLYQNKDNRKVKLLFRCYYLSFSILIIRIFYETFIVNQGNFLVGNKIELLIGGSNYLASMLLIPVAISLTRTFLLKATWIDVAVLLTSLAGIIFTGSRTVIIISTITIIGFVTGIILISKLSLKKKIYSFGMFIIGMLLMYKLSFNFFMQMVSDDRFNNLSQQANVLSRFSIFQVYLTQWQKHILFGNGFMNIEVDGINTLAHNTFFQLLADNGAVGTVIMLFCIINIFRLFIKLIKSINFNQDRELWCWIFGLLLGFTLTVIHGMFEPNWGTRQYMLVMFMGLGILFLVDSKRIPVKKRHRSGRAYHFKRRN